MRQLICCLACLSPLAVAGLTSPSPQADAQRVLGAVAETVAVDFQAVTAQGVPVDDLTVDEVRLKVDGRIRQIRSLQYVRLPSATPVMNLTAPAELRPPFGTNATVDAGRVVVLVIDEETIEPGRQQEIKRSINEFLSALAANDRVALVTVPHGGLQVDLTTDRARLSEAVSHIAPHGSRQTDQDAACRTRLTLQALAGTLNSLSHGDGPTTMVFVSSSQVGSRGEEARSAASPLASRICELLPEEFTKVGVAAARARAQFYMILPDDPVLQSGLVNGRVGLENLGGVTGGPLLNLAGASGTGLLRVARETSGYYLAAFQPDAAERSGATHQVSVQITRRGVVVRSRPGLEIAKADARGRAPIKMPLDMLRDGAHFSELPLRVVGYAVRERGSDMLKIVGMMAPVDPQVRLTAAAAGLIDANGKLVAQWTARSSDILGGQVVAGLLARPGFYRLRMAATDFAGRSGAADYDLTAELMPAGPLSLSGIVLGTGRGGRFEPRLEFADEPAALASLEIYGRPAGGWSTVAVSFELAASLNGPAITTTPAVVEPTGESDRFVATGAIPLGSVPAGDFAVRAIVQAEGRPAGRVVRTVRKTG